MRIRSISYAVVAQEQHLDGANHFHVYAQLEGRRYFSAAQVYNALGIHAYISTCDLGWLIYILKFDPDWICDGITRAEILQLVAERRPQKITEVIAQRLNEGDTVEDVQRAFPGYYLQHRKQILEFKADIDSRKTKEDKASKRKQWKKLDASLYTGVNKKLAHY